MTLTACFSPQSPLNITVINIISSTLSALQAFPSQLPNPPPLSIIFIPTDPCKYQQTVTKQPCDLQFDIHIYLPALIYLQGEAKDTQFLDKNQLMLKLSIIVIRLVTKHFEDIDKEDYH